MTHTHKDGVTDILLRAARQAARQAVDTDGRAPAPREADASRPDAAWQEGVMRRVRALRPPMPEPGLAGLLARLARLAPAAWAAGGAAAAAAVVALWCLPDAGLDLAATAVRANLYGASGLGALFGL